MAHSMQDKAKITSHTEVVTEARPDSMPDLSEPLVVMDGGRSIRFTGAQIAFASSERPRAPRFTEFRLYRTSKDMYVVSRTGCSRVFHSSTCRQAESHRLPYGNDLQVIPEVTRMYPCGICNPSRMEDARGIRFERERPWAGVADNAPGVVAMLTQVESKKTGLTSGSSSQIPNLSARLLTVASEIDTDIRAAYLVMDI